MIIECSGTALRTTSTGKPDLMDNLGKAFGGVRQKKSNLLLFCEDPFRNRYKGNGSHLTLYRYDGVYNGLSARLKDIPPAQYALEEDRLLGRFRYISEKNPFDIAWLR
jgi:hypothetical protein